MDWTYAARTLAGLLAILNPLGAIPVFISLTMGWDAATRMRTARIAAVATGLVLSTAALAGDRILAFFGISIAAFRVGGGILVLLMAIHMMQAKRSGARQTPEETEAAAEKDSVAVVPLAIPLLAGPGAISTVILNAHQTQGFLGFVMLGGIIWLMAGAVYLALTAAVPVARRLGVLGINITTRILGLLLAAIAVEFIADGLKELFPLLAGG